MGINQLVIGHPKRIVYTGHPLEMVNISGRSYKFDTRIFCQFAHPFGYNFLVVITVTPQIIGDDEVEMIVQQRVQSFVRNGVLYLCLQT